MESQELSKQFASLIIDIKEKESSILTLTDKSKGINPKP